MPSPVFFLASILWVLVLALPVSSKKWILEEMNGEFSFYYHMRVLDGDTMAFVYDIYDSFSWNSDLYLYKYGEKKIFEAYTDIQTFLKLKKETVVLDRFDKPIGSVQQDFFNNVGQKAISNFVATQTGFGQGFIPGLYRSYTWYDMNHREKGSVVKRELGDTNLFFRVHPGRGADDDDESIIKASAKKEMTSKLSSLVLMGTGKWAIDISRELEKDTMFILLIVADKARHDMQAQAELRAKAIKALTPKEKNKNEEEYDDTRDVWEGL